MSEASTEAASGESASARIAQKFAEISPETTRARTLVWQDPTTTVEAGAEMAGLDYMNALAAGELPPPPISVVMQMAPTEVEKGKVAFEGRPGEEHYNPIGVVHGGYASTVLDSVMGCAVHTTLDPGVRYTTQTLEIKFVRAISRDTGTVRAEGEVVYLGRKQATVQARLLDAQSGKLLATATSTCMILGG